MLYCCVSIDYLSQLERSGTREAGAFLDEVRTLTEAFGASTGPRRSPLVVSFPSGGMFDGIQTAEALLRVFSAFGSYQGFLRGASVVVHEAPSMEDALAYATAKSVLDCSTYSFYMSPEAISALEPYFAPGDGSWTPPLHSVALADADSGRLFERPRLAATLAKAIARSGQGGPRLVHLEAGPGARSLESLARESGPTNERLLVLGGSKTRTIPFSPLAETVAGAGAGAGAAAAAIPARRRDDRAALEYVASSSFSGGSPASVSKGCAAFLHTWLDGFGEFGGIVACDAPERFSRETRALIAERLSGGRGSEKYLSLSDGSLVDQWAGPWAARVPSGLADADDRPASVERALGSSSGAVREALDHRFRSISGEAGVSGPGLPSLLDALPPEASIYLFALSIIENELSAAEISRFLGSLGLEPEGEKLLQGLLSRSGLVEPLTSRTPIEPLDTEAILAKIGTEAARTIRERLSRFLIELYRSGRIRPSLGFLKRVGELPGEERLLYDCLFEDMLRADRPGTIDPGFLSPSSTCVYRFWTALTARDRAASEAQAAAEDRITGARAQAVRALVRAELAYACGDPERASRGAREAMLAMGKGAPPRLEARSQRMMGLSALALDKHTEAADYLTNAQELSETSGVDYERMMAAYAKAIVEFLSGSLVRSGKALQCAEESASVLFRMDVMAAIEALRGRIELELGSYDEAARRFSSLEELASEYAMPEAARRASIWRARALAYAGDFETASAVLEAERSDAEARAFRGEVEILRGRPRDARPYLDGPREPPIRPFDPSDAFDWSSLFSEFEGRSIGFEAADAPLEEFRTALSLFARGLDERDPACAVELHALTRSEKGAKNNPGRGTYSFFCYLLEERLPEPPIDKQTVLSRAFKILQQRAGRIEDRAQRALYMEKNSWNKRLIEAARTHKFI